MCGPTPRVSGWRAVTGAPQADGRRPMGAMRQCCCRADHARFSLSGGTRSWRQFQRWLGKFGRCGIKEGRVQSPPTTARRFGSPVARRFCGRAFARVGKLKGRGQPWRLPLICRFSERWTGSVQPARWPCLAAGNLHLVTQRVPVMLGRALFPFLAGLIVRHHLLWVSSGLAPIRSRQLSQARIYYTAWRSKRQ